MVLNVVLAGAVVYAGVELRVEWLAARAREARIQRGKPAPAPPPPFTRLPEVAPVMASGYASVAQKFLLDPSRNPDLPVEAPAPPPPKPPMPALPVFHGMWNIGDGPEILMSEKPDSAYKRLHAGDTIGDFTLVAFNSEQVELEWSGQRIVKSVADLEGRHTTVEAAGGAPLAWNDPAAATRPKIVEEDKGPGQENAIGERACVPGDTAPPGTERDGVVKTIIKNPLFGTENCVWKPRR
jgi:hypothetical protein